MKLTKSALMTVFILCLGSSNSESVTENGLIQRYLEKLEKSDYNPLVMPESHKGDRKPLDIKCSMYILDIFNLDEENKEFQAQFYFRHSWTDPRLAYPDQDIRKIVLNDAKYVWTPDLFFVEEKEGILHNIIKPNVFLGIQKSGEVLFSERLTMTFRCPMDFRKFPHDVQKCNISVESYGFTRSTLELMWVRKSVGRDENINLPFEITNMEEGIRYLNLSTGEYTTIYVELTFQRKAGFFVTRLYIPYIFLVVLSWFSFWIPAKLIALRLTMLLVILYLLVNIGSDINTHAPKTPYTKGSDVWIAVCQSLVFASILEFIAIHMVKRINVKAQENLANNDSEARSVLDPDAKISPEIQNVSNSAISSIAARLKVDTLQPGSIDKSSRIMFPVLFICFNFIYWIVYCTGN